MKQFVTIARALKEKNRVAGRLRKVREQIWKENSGDKRVPRGVDVADLLVQSRVLRDRLIAIKSAIAVANHPIVPKIIELDETKSEIAFFDGLNAKEGVFLEMSYGTKVEVEFEAVIRKPQVLAEVAELQKKADRLQDELDEFNAATKVSIEID